MKRGIIFDMDGTLWDSAENVAKSWDTVVQREANGLRRITTLDIQQVMGHTMTEIAEMLFPMLSAKEAAGLMDQCCKEENDYLRTHGGVLYPNLENTLQDVYKRQRRDHRTDGFIKPYGSRTWRKNECLR